MNQISPGERFFVYGSMTQGLVHFQRIQDFILSSVTATVQATAYQLKVGFPVVVEGGVDAVDGELVTVQSSELLLGMLDQFHGFQVDQPEKSLYWRKKTLCQTAAGFVESWIYFLNPKHLAKSAVPVEKGDWRSLMRSSPTLIEKLTEKQKEYIRKLRAVTGRQVIPIDLPLYRELMNLEIIVDKGRRLALSPLGHEVCRYLPE